MRVLLGRQPDNSVYVPPGVCADCGREVWLGVRQAALAASREADVVVRCVSCSDSLGVLRVLRGTVPGR